MLPLGESKPDAPNFAPGIGCDANVAPPSWENLMVVVIASDAGVPGPVLHSATRSVPDEAVSVAVPP